MFRKSFVFALILAAVPVVLLAQSSDEEAIRSTALDYALGWYSGDAARMERALHPDLAKRIAKRDAEGKVTLDKMTADELIGATGKGFGTRTPEDKRVADVKILDRFENVASVRLDMSGWIDYMHLTRVGDGWKIVNVLWELKPRPAPKE